MGLDFLILYEHIVREYESILLLKAELERRGYTVAVRQLLDRKQLRYFTLFKPKVIVTHCMYDNESLNSHVYNNCGKVQKVVNLHWEQILSREQEDSPWFNCGQNARFAVHTCWGEKTRLRLINQGVPEKNVVVTGCVALDFLHKQFNGYYKTKEQLCRMHGLKPQNELVLYISSFGYANMSDEEVEELSKMAGLSFVGFRDTNKKTMETTLDWFEKALQSNHERAIIYRPHPSEWDSPRLEDMAKKYNNFVVISEHSVKQWVVACDRIYTWMSTSLAEIYFAGKTCGILRPYPVEVEYDPVTYEDAKFITTEEEFLEHLTNEQKEYPFDVEKLKSFYDVDKELSYVRIANLLSQVHEQPPRSLPFSEGYKPKFNALKYFALIGIHFFHFFRFDPSKLKKILPGFASFAGRIYGYIDKAYISHKDSVSLQKRIELFLGRGDD